VSAAFDATPRLEKYELLEELGHGGMATVYRARDRRLGREVALKVIHRHLRDQQEVGERFAREAKAVAKLRHPSIVEVYDVSEPSESERYLVVELVRGITLRKLLKEHAPLPPELVLGIGLRLAEALEHAHSLGVVHRDVKPENVLLALPLRLRGASVAPEPSSGSNPSSPSLSSSAGLSPRESIEVKLTDFGIAKVLDVQGVTSTGEVLGSPAHMAPEQIEGQSVGPKADLFSLGVLLYEALVGNLPFQGNNPAQVLRRVLEGQFVPTERARPEVGSLIGRVVDRALAHDPERRFEHAGALSDAIREELDRVHFPEPLGELAAYLDDPAAYEAAYPSKILPHLLEAAAGARRDGRIPLAASLYNRALSLRPGDPAIVRAVARLTRLGKLRRRVVPVTVTCVILAAGAVLGYRAVKTHAGHRRVLAASPATPATGTVVSPVVGVKQPVPTNLDDKPTGALERREGRREDDRDGARTTAEVRSTSGGGRTSGKTTSHPSVAGATRTVQVELRGAKGSRLLIDGTERPWFGVKHELAYGVHRFHVIAPTENCCVVPEPKVVRIGPGEGEIRVVLFVEFRDAQLQLAGSEGATLTCGELFPGILEAPGRRSVRLTQAETHASCTLIPPVESGKRPRTIDVVLRPGGTFTVDGT
jgi:serine/threonine-protein kinase